MKTILHDNYYSFTTKLLDILLLIKHITEDFLFHEQLGQTKMQNDMPEFAYPDLFVKGITRLSTGIELV